MNEVLSSDNDSYDSDSDIDKLMGKVQKRKRDKIASMSTPVKDALAKDDNDDEDESDEDDKLNNDVNMNAGPKRRRKKRLDDTEQKLLRVERRTAKQTAKTPVIEITGSDSDDGDTNQLDATKPATLFNNTASLVTSQSSAANTKHPDHHSDDDDSSIEVIAPPQGCRNTCLDVLEQAANVLKQANQESLVEKELDSPVRPALSPVWHHRPITVTIRPTLVEFKTNQETVHPTITLQVNTATETIQDLHKKVAQMLKLNELAAVVTLKYQGRTLHAHQTVSSYCDDNIKITLDAIVHLTGLHSTTTKAMALRKAAADLGQTITLTLRQMIGKEKQETHLDIRSKETFQMLVDKYREKLSIAKSKKIAFYFDGDKILLTKTPESLDMECDDLIDVKVQ